MCMCGGIIEAGIIAALVGYIGKRIHKCKCDCHEEHLHKCKHCSDHDAKEKAVVIQECGSFTKTEYMKYNVKRFNKRKIFYKAIQYIFGVLIFGGLIFASVGIYKTLNKHKHHDCTEIHCSHNKEK